MIHCPQSLRVFLPNAFRIYLLSICTVTAMTCLGDCSALFISQFQSALCNPHSMKQPEVSFYFCFKSKPIMSSSGTAIRLPACSPYSAPPRSQQGFLSQHLGTLCSSHPPLYKYFLLILKLEFMSVPSEKLDLPSSDKTLAPCYSVSEFSFLFSFFVFFKVRVSLCSP